MAIVVAAMYFGCTSVVKGLNFGGRGFDTKFRYSKVERALGVVIIPT